MQYQSFEFLWPPRPENAIPPSMLGLFERRGFVAQAKLNGTCNVIAVSPERKLVCMNRHNETHKLWAPTPASSAAFADLPGSGWYVFVGELLHSKVKDGVRDTNYLHDVLVADGVHQTGVSYADRHALLTNLFVKGGEEETETHVVVTPNTWVAKNVTSGFKGLFGRLTSPEDEGLVLKDPSAPLAFCGLQKANAGWQVKCRRAHKNYGF